MSRQLTKLQKIENSLTGKYRRTLWKPFLTAISRYDLLCPGDRVAVCISGGKDSMLMAKLMQMLARHSKFPFENVFLVMDPGYSEENLQKIRDNARTLDLPVTVFHTRIFAAADQADHSPCYLCARMRRGALYAKARELGCCKIALGHHRNDVIETTLLGMLYSSQLSGMMPKVRSRHFEGMELIRPLYMVREEDIISWASDNGLEFLRCACHFTQEYTRTHNAGEYSSRQSVKKLIKVLAARNPAVEESLFNSLNNVCLETFPGWSEDGQRHSFLEWYDEKK